jgi:ribonuclease HI
MGMGWLLIDGDKKIAQFNASSFEWPSSTRMEILAVVSLLSILPVESHINIFTDSNNVIKQYSKLKEMCLSYRKRRKVINFNLWEILFWVEKEFSLKIRFTKVKAHSGHKLNDQADYLAKAGINRPSLRINDVVINQKASLAWLEFTVDKNPREFIKEVNLARIENQIENLNRVKSLHDIDKNTSLEFINHKEEKSDLGFFSLKDDNVKSFRVKKLFNDLPTMDNLIKRNPKVYKQEYKCPRCLQDTETLNHLWECSNANNDLILLSLKAKKKLFKLIDKSEKFKYKSIADLKEELFPFFKTKKQLQWYNEVNSEFYKKFDDKKFKLEYTYVWNGLDSFDNILKGWIPIRLVQILRKYLKRDSKAFIKNLLIKWLGKVDNMFFEKIWKPRNEDMQNWEKDKGISKLQKRRKIDKKMHSRSRSETRKNNKIAFSGKKKSSVHVMDEQLESKIRIIFGLDRKGFHRVLD